ncbi:DUF1659 domain-containing protein [Ignavigranum ruoffiae]|uniref:DUF1659 domain-containing protein n=1 Tax=Ignavigranum ruoffiae TaxID=89093 RepID=A0A1H9GZX8_9LACT|nr:hypothetical protein [Ignavigranum ruoffiae]SEQ55538.1 hypothetical protein SAMN04488558_1217 [Ignavigranum ruoffiae]
MIKSYNQGRLQAKFSDGTKKGKSINITGVIENYEEDQLNQVTEALKKVSAHPLTAVVVSQSYKYTPRLH